MNWRAVHDNKGLERFVMGFQKLSEHERDSIRQEMILFLEDYKKTDQCGTPGVTNLRAEQRADMVATSRVILNRRRRRPTRR